MECKTVSNYITDYIDGVLDKNIQKEIRNHIEKCSVCKAEFKQTKELFLSIEKSPIKMPGQQLKVSFDKVLSDEKAKLEKDSQGVLVIKLKSYKILWQVAAAVLLLVSGYLAGYNSNGGSTNDTQVANMQNDIKEMKQQMHAISLLNNESASQRIKAVNYTEGVEKPSSAVIDALINTLETDKNSNVRLAAVYSLSRFKNDLKVKEALINTLNEQEDPMVQIVIINLLVNMEEIQALDKLKELLKKKNLHQEVKSQAELGVKILS